jgi:putative acetyltransferase
MTKQINIAIDDLSDGAIAELLNDHLKQMYQYSPPESIHAIDPENLKHKSVTFWSAYVGESLAGCGALKELSSTAAEIKSMKTNHHFLRMGIATKLLRSIIAEAKNRSYATLSLETGSHAAFEPAINMYKKYGFIECGPFADYKMDPYSKFLRLDLIT